MIRPSRRGMGADIKEYGIVLGLYLLTTLIFTFPMVLHMSAYVAGDGGDAFQTIWNNWWMKKALLELGQNPFYTDFLFYPQGETMLFNVFMPVYGLLSIPLRFVFNPLAVYNILLIGSFLAAGLGMYLLLRYLTQNKVAAFMGGFIFIFSPCHMAHSLGHFHMVAVEWVPFYALWFLKAQEHYRMKYVLLAALSLSLAMLNTPYFLVFCLLFSGIYILFFGVRDGDWGPALKKFLGICLAGAVMLSPLLIPMIRESMGNEFWGQHDPEEFSADVLSFFVPSMIQTTGRLFRDVTERFTGGVAENSNYLGYVVIFLSGLAITKFRKKNKFIPFLFFAAFVPFVLSLGMHLHVYGEAKAMALPYMFLKEHVPGFSFSGIPERFHMMTMFGLAALSAFAVKHILEDGGPKAKMLTAGLFVLLVIEFISIPFPVSPVPGECDRTMTPPSLDPMTLVPRFYRNIAGDAEDYVVLDTIALDIPDTEGIYYQTIHQKRILGGRVSRVKKRSMNDLWGMSVISDIFSGNIPYTMKTLPAEWRREFARHMLEKYNVRYVVLPRRPEKAMRRSVMDFYGLCQVYEDSKIWVYQSCPAP